MPSPRTDPFVTGLILGAGGSSRLGRPKQLLPYRHTTLLGHAVGTARACRFNQIVVAYRAVLAHAGLEESAGVHGAARTLA